MVKKKYTKPAVVMVKLSHEQAVLGACSSDGTSAVENVGTNGCAALGCKAKQHGTVNSAVSS